MEVESNEHCKTIIKIVVAIALIFLVVLFIVQDVHADVFVYGSIYNYSEVVVPNNSYVHQGENISQGRYYDLSGVYGWSGLLANW